MDGSVTALQRRERVMSAGASVGRSRVYEKLIHVRCESMEGARHCRVLDLKSDRASIESFVPLFTGAKVNLLLHLPTGDVMAAGFVTSHQLAVGFDVAFTEVSSGDQKALVGFTSC